MAFLWSWDYWSWVWSFTLRKRSGFNPHYQEIQTCLGSPDAHPPYGAPISKSRIQQQLMIQ
jgi:hypothetical protein